VQAAIQTSVTPAAASPEAAARAPLLELRAVTKTFGETTALAGLEASIAPGEFVTVVGPSGCGKSTLFNIVAGLEEPDPGGILRFEGNSCHAADLLGRVSFMPQSDLLLPWRNVVDNAILALEVEGVKRPEARAKARKMLPEFGLAGFERQYPHQLSGGMRQRVALMRTFLFERDLMLLDEPFGALDALTRAHLQDSVMAIHQKLANTVLMITHDVDEAVLLSDRIVMMTNGPAACIGEVLEVPLARPRKRLELASNATYLKCRQRVLEFLYERHRFVEAA
jgi:ABC-type nitrate/sulfonate/bicarbonate transport system ATPase subunit